MQNRVVNLEIRHVARHIKKKEPFSICRITEKKRSPLSPEASTPPQPPHSRWRQGTRSSAQRCGCATPTRNFPPPRCAPRKSHTARRHLPVAVPSAGRASRSARRRRRLVGIGAQVRPHTPRQSELPLERGSRDFRRTRCLRPVVRHRGVLVRHFALFTALCAPGRWLVAHRVRLHARQRHHTQ